MKKKWPGKDSREDHEIDGFLSAYKNLPHGRSLVIETKREKPDYFVKAPESGEIFGVELTSVYLSDRSVPDLHMKKIDGWEEIQCDPDTIENYKIRLIEMIQDKLSKARKGYDTRFPMILSMYVNEYISLYMEDADWQAFVKSYESIFDAVHPFIEIVFWNPSSLSGDIFWAFSVRPSP